VAILASPRHIINIAEIAIDQYISGMQRVDRRLVAAVVAVALGLLEIVAPSLRAAAELHDGSMERWRRCWR